jgi:hypothetical protein
MEIATEFSALGNFAGSDSLDVAIYNAVNVNTQDQPGSTLIHAWDGLVPKPVGSGILVSIPVTGVTLSGGTKYFMVLTPVSLSDDSYNLWYDSLPVQSGTVLSSPDGTTSSWSDASNSPTLPAFDIIGTPEPGTVLLFGAGLLAILSARRQKMKLVRCCVNLAVRRFEVALLPNGQQKSKFHLSFVE